MAKVVSMKRGIEVVAYLSGPLAIKDEGYENANKYVEKREPEQTHAEKPCISAESDYSRGADECGTIAHGHDIRMGLPSCDKITLCVLCALPSTIAEIESDQKVY